MSEGFIYVLQWVLITFEIKTITTNLKDKMKMASLKLLSTASDT